MEKVISFKGSNKPHLNQLNNNMAYYSEDDKSENDNNTPVTKTCEVKNNGKNFNFNEPDLKGSDKQMSKFYQQKGVQNHAGDEDEAEIEDYNQKGGYNKLGGSAPQKKDLHKRFLAKQGKDQKVDSDHEAKNRIDKQSTVDALKNHPWRHLIFGPAINDNTFKKHLTLTYRGLVYAKKCLKGPSEKFIKTKQVIVPDSKIPKSRTLLLDLDETLIHSCSLKENPDHIVWAKSEYGEESKIGLKIRPYCLEFLQKLSQLWDIYIFTASSPAYATAIINFLDPEAKYIIGILNRGNCMETKNGFFIKDLRILKNKSLKTMVLVDNLAHSFGFQIENGIPILEWHSDKNDMELKHLMNYLVEAAQVDDVRKFNRDRLRLLELADTKMEDLLI